MKTDAVILVDYQNGFIPMNEWGTWELGVVDGGNICSQVNQILWEVKSQWGIVIATKDWHPNKHISFSQSYGKEWVQQITAEEILTWTPENNPLSKNADFVLDDIQNAAREHWDQWMWPDHCIENTDGSRYYEWLDISLIDHHIHKWDNADTNVYSGFSGAEINTKINIQK